MTFSEMGLSKALLNALTRLNITTPTPIQEQAIPLALQGRDILGSAQTGTGKTLAFGLPLCEFLMNNPESTALILLPTRELAMQVQKSLMDVLKEENDIQSVLLIGGDSMPKQLNALKRHPRLIVGTPGRINDHLKRRTLSLFETAFLVLDETDRMLDMGFGPQLETIAAQLPIDCQTLMFSATLPKNIMSLAGKYLNEPVRIAVAENNATLDKITQETIMATETEKFFHLEERLKSNSSSFIVFVKTKYGADKLAKRIKIAGFEADSLHGDLRQSQRERVTQNFRDFKLRVLVATDVAARGLDIAHIEYVVNYDMPMNPEDYIHRIGRTGRAGKTGTAINLVSGEDKAKWRAVQRLLDPSLKEEKAAPSATRGKKRPFGKKEGDKPFFKKDRERRQAKRAA